MLTAILILTFFFFYKQSKQAKHTISFKLNTTPMDKHLFTQIYSHFLTENLHLTGSYIEL